jgi:pantetheine-phosphate adenylyltransferase
MSRIAVYAGSFDPPTNGHHWMIQKGLTLFDHLVIAVGNNPAKKPMFSVGERINLIKEMLSYENRFSVASMGNQFLVDFCKTEEGRSAQFLLRGVRDANDFNYELSQSHVNQSFDPSIVTVFLTPPQELSSVSSSLVKGMIGFEGWYDRVSPLVTSNVREALAWKCR